jgi:hypothetical protein
MLDTKDSNLFDKADMPGGLNPQQKEVFDLLGKNWVEESPQDMDPNASMNPANFMKHPFNASKTFVKECLNIRN